MNILFFNSETEKEPKKFLFILLFWAFVKFFGAVEPKKVTGKSEQVTKNLDRVTETNVMLPVHSVTHNHLKMP